jgi:hypothetical protein
MRIRQRRSIGPHEIFPTIRSCVTTRNCFAQTIPLRMIISSESDQGGEVECEMLSYQYLRI